MKNLRSQIIAPVLLLSLAGVLSLSACHNEKKENAAEEQSETGVPPVETVVLEKSKMMSSLQVPGELNPYQQVSIYAKLNSYVKKYLVDVGSEVRRGQLMIILEAPEINSQLASARARVKQQEAVYLASKANYDRLVNTAKTPGTIAQNDIDLANARQKSDYANVEAAKAGLQEVSQNLQYLQIRAPFDGVVSERNASMGAYVGPNGKGSDLPLFVVQQQKKLRLVISVPEMSTGALTGKEEVSFTVRALPEKEFTAKVKRAAGALDARLRSERLEMDVENPKKILLPGMYAEVSIPLKSKDSSFVVPKTALVQSTEKMFVIRVAGNHKAEWVDVQKGLQSKDGVQVYSKDLKAGDKIILAATDEIRDGGTVDDKAAANKEETTN
ncbi:efflux RND transporter periplasmic adaptor subunit [Mucilaginibacter aquatilis]|uniref:Efflux RND transporter periplasmic adaptor subunit n=1 Tax=Mucilaginibacter aquatilis TaxID=1517760 RepID=A0A6I4I610_9SPHI|nr:efflux RND transporter periplasmic adaptor subunit [Mucilaginibacter aquatilis]MVN89568.1 efflux RND transporter periplasmic adaptor subunit [Mucilaginibacter aquatilis]